VPFRAAPGGVPPLDVSTIRPADFSGRDLDLPPSRLASRASPAVCRDARPDHIGVAVERAGPQGRSPAPGKELAVVEMRAAGRLEHRIRTT
jgi:hypothetical protein